MKNITILRYIEKYPFCDMASFPINTLQKFGDKNLIKIHYRTFFTNKDLPQGTLQLTSAGLDAIDLHDRKLAQKRLNTCAKQLQDFVESPTTRNAWLKDRYLKVYVRKSKRMIENELKLVLDIATVGARDPGKGYFTRFLDDAVRINPYQGVYIENVLTPRFADYFRNKGWHQIGDDDIPCFYLLKP